MNLTPDDPSAIQHASSNQWQMLDSFKQYVLQNDDEVALAYTTPPDPPPITFSFHTH
jgi:hypothetical protein